ncbi:LysR family transcriptional regulator [Puniceibacterium sediminis]|uniref:DNA-binding transcriptional regulator, LysR family n=1 Tax=Puniceibacterium sediminis TaxID=1608407 RepID=A0A238X6J8_9RHOB|nr:LysR substrate-binding domain-containing protein [Puniceibacterium sediminis]SNR54201.1 DNA-binding transcriptional regulator, LysR family [Puniceibacterium sediminis]
MKNANRDLAIFAALPVLEAAVRHNSFTRAAREFGLTQSALSRRIQGLERDLGLVLFARRGRSITITHEGAKLAKAARASLDLIESARHDLGNEATGTVRVGILPSLGGFWLAPRLPDFCAKFPNVSLRVVNIDAEFQDGHKDPITWDPSSLDIVVTRGHGGWQSLTAKRLTQEYMIAVKRPDTPTNTKLGHSTRSGAWKAYIDASPQELQFAPPAVVFEHFYMIIEAARAGAGVALVPNILVSQDLSSGRLEACGPAQSTGASYYAVFSDRSAHRPSSAAFIEWLQKDALEL